MTAQIQELDRYGLSRAQLLALGATPVTIRARFATWSITPALRRRRPSDRHDYMDQRAQRWYRSAARRWPVETHRLFGDAKLPEGVESTVPARSIRQIERFPGVETILLVRIRGRRKRRIRYRGPFWWFTVRATVAIQVEGQHRGLQYVADRFVLVRAISKDDAVRRLAREWRSYGKPYLNSRGELVRWHLEEITDVHDTCEETIDPSGTEIYSELRSRRIRPAHVWSRRK